MYDVTEFVKMQQAVHKAESAVACAKRELAVTKKQADYAQKVDGPKIDRLIKQLDQLDKAQNRAEKNADRKVKGSKTLSRAKLRSIENDYKRRRQSVNDTLETHERKLLEAQRPYREAKRKCDELHRVYNHIATEFAHLQRETHAALARELGIPAEYCNSMKVVQENDGRVHVYFGGNGSPDGARHGHYVRLANGHVPYARMPAEAHGPQNYIHHYLYYPFSG